MFCTSRILLFKAIEEDINVRISLTKTPFTQKHKQITDTQNFIEIVQAFYFLEVPNRSSVNDNKNNNNNNDNNPTNSIQEFDGSYTPKRIQPDKVNGSGDGKSWDLFFLQINFEAEKSYKLHFDDRFLFDSDYHKFKENVIFPTFRVETKKEEIFNMVDKIREIKEEVNAKKKLEKEENPKKPPAPTTHKKCSNNGKLIYDNILKRYHCSCIHGYTGKYCANCDGVINPKTKVCEIEEDENEENNNNINESDKKIDQWKSQVNIPQEISAEEYHNHNKNDKNTNVLSCGNCNHGFCDTSIGRCICEIGYTGKYCDSIKKSEAKIFGNKDANKSSFDWGSYFYSFFDYIIKGM